MGIRGTFLFISLSIFNFSFAQVQTDITPLPSNDWSRISSPTVGKPFSLGFYSNGCIRGAVSLPTEGTGYQSMRTFRNRFYGQPELISFIQNYGKQLAVFKSGILVGDLGQPRGGPMPYGHTSHQVGLDVDIWFWTHPEQNNRSLSLEERNNLPMPTVLAANGLVDETLFTNEHILKLKLAALSPGVERIFVNPAIKTYLCSRLPVNELSWLNRLRPWAGHDDHYHIRLSCPNESPDCIHQAPQDLGDGCAELMPPRRSLTFDPVDLDETTMQPSIEQLITGDGTKNALPKECEKVLKE